MSSRVSIACYAPGSDGLWRPRYPFGTATGAVLNGGAFGIAGSVAALATGVSFIGSGFTVADATATLNTIPAAAHFAGAASAVSGTVGALVVGFSITTTSLPAANVGVAYSQTITSDNGVGTVTYTVTPSVPGMSLSTAGLFSGTPTTAGTTDLTFTASYTTSSTATVTVNSTAQSVWPYPNQQPGNGGSGQNPALLTNTMPSKLPASVTMFNISTCADYGGTTVHTSPTLTDTEGNTYTHELQLAGINQSSGGSTDQSQQTDYWVCLSIKGDGVNGTPDSPCVITQSYNDGATDDDRDYQANFALCLNQKTTLIGIQGQKQGSSTSTAPGAAVAANSSNSVNSGTAITVTSAQVPCTMFAFAFNISSLGTNDYTPTAGSDMPGTEVASWSLWPTLADTADTYADAIVMQRTITTAGSYLAVFNNPSNSQEWFHCAAIIFAGVVTATVHTTSSTLPFTVNPASAAVVNLPSDFYVTLQGQTAPNTAPEFPFTNASGGTDYAGGEGSPYMGLGWPAAAAGTYPVAGYNIRRSTDQSTWTTIGTKVAYAPNSYGTCFADTNATNCVGSTYGPTNNVYCAATNYYYQIQTVDTQGNVSAWSAYPKMYAYIYGSGGESVTTPSAGDNTGVGGGYKWIGDLSANCQNNYAASDATYGEVWTATLTGSFGYMLQTTGWLYPQYNQWVGATTNLYFLMKVSSTNIIPGLHGEIVGDLAMQPPNGPLAPGSNNLDMRQYVAGGASAYAANTYQLYTIPRSTFMTPLAGWPGPAGSIGVLQGQFYKFLIQDANDNIGGVITIAKCWFQ